MTLRGTPTIYYGDELGMRDVQIPPDRVQDPFEHNVPGIGVGRDPVRTPMAWDTGPNAGFTTGAPWLPIDDNPELVVAKQTNDPGSMLEMHRQLLTLRRQESALNQGDYQTVHVDNQTLVYARTHGARRLVIALNLTPDLAEVPRLGSSLLATGEGPSSSPTVLGPDEGRITLA